MGIRAVLLYIDAPHGVGGIIDQGRAKQQLTEGSRVIR